MELSGKYQSLWKKAGIIGGVYLAMKYVVPPVAPFLIAALAAWWLRPAFARLEKWCRIKPGILAVLFLLLLFGGLGVGLYFLGGQLVDWGGNALAEQATGETAPATGRGMIVIRQALVDGCEAVERIFGFPAERTEQLILTRVQVWQDQWKGRGLERIFDGSLSAVKGVGKVAAAFLVGIIAFVMLCSDFEKIREEVSQSGLFARAAALGKGIKEAIGSYVKAQCIIIGMIMVICVAGFWLTGNPYALMLGIATGFLDALPVLGTGLVLLPWTLIQVLRGEYLTALILGLTYGACALTREILEPKLIGKRLGLFPVLVLLSVYVGVKVYGGSGIILGPLSLLVIQELWKRC